MKMIKWSEEKVEEIVKQKPELIPKHIGILPDLEIQWGGIWWLVVAGLVILLIVVLTMLIREIRKCSNGKSQTNVKIELV